MESNKENIELIPNLYFKEVKDLIANYIANERNIQIEIAKQKGYNKEKIKDEIDFTIFTDKFKPLNKDDLPCIVIDINSTEYSPRMQYPNKVYAESKLQIYLFAKGKNENNITDDKTSSIRLDYLLSQILSICNNSKAFNFGTDSNKEQELEKPYIDKKILISWKRILNNQEENQLESILGYVLEYNISYFEYFTNNN